MAGRLDELLARNLGTSKTAARALIAAGRVRGADGGAALADPRAVAPAEVIVDEGGAGARRLPLVESALVLLHKPAGVVTALRDARYRAAYELLREAPLYAELRPVGRLDLDTTGLLLWTSDGALIQRLTHPKRRVPRTYEAALARPFGPIPAGGLVLEDGHRPEIVELVAIGAGDAHPALALAAPAGAPGAPILARVTIIGGAYHEVRRIFAALGSHVLALCRTRFGDHALPTDLAPGAWRAADLPRVRANW